MVIIKVIEVAAYRGSSAKIALFSKKTSIGPSWGNVLIEEIAEIRRFDNELQGEKIDIFSMD
jgi:hypothetical protein